MRRQIRPKNIRLLSAMGEQGFTVRLLSERALLTPATVSRVLNQRLDPKPETKIKIATALGLRVKDLFPEVGQ